MSNAPPLIEPAHCPDIFACGIAKVERIGGDCVRLTLYVNDTDDTGKPVRVVVAKLVRPISMLLTPQLLAMIAHTEAVPFLEVTH